MIFNIILINASVNTNNNKYQITVNFNKCKFIKLINSVKRFEKKVEKIQYVFC